MFPITTIQDVELPICVAGGGLMHKKLSAATLQLLTGSSLSNRLTRIGHQGKRRKRMKLNCVVFVDNSSVSLSGGPV